VRHVFIVVAVYRVFSARLEGRTLSPKLSTWPVSAPAVAASECAESGRLLMKLCPEEGESLARAPLQSSTPPQRALNSKNELASH